MLLSGGSNRPKLYHIVTKQFTYTFLTEDAREKYLPLAEGEVLCESEITEEQYELLAAA